MISIGNHPVLSYTKLQNHNPEQITLVLKSAVSITSLHTPYHYIVVHQQEIHLK